MCSYKHANDTTSLGTHRFFPRGTSPFELRPNTEFSAPDPSTWGTPYAYWTLGANCSPTHFTNHNLVSA